jgi:hypothetical protein
MRSVKTDEVVMYSQNGASAARNAMHSPLGLAGQKPTLKDLFKGQPLESFSAGDALIWEGDQAGQISDVLEGVLRVYKILPDGDAQSWAFSILATFSGCVSNIALSSPPRP